jgi:hypothetical protein
MHARLRRFWLASALALAPISFSTAFQHDLVLGTWVLNLEKSSYDPGPAPRSQTRIYEAVPEGIKATILTVDPKGRSITARYTAAYDSLEHPLTGSTAIDAIALKRINAYTAEATLTHGRKLIGTARRVISEDGKTMTITYRGTDENGRQVHNVAVYEKDLRS